MLLLGKNPEITAIFDCQLQYYIVYKNGQVLVSHKYRYRDIESYLN